MIRARGSGKEEDLDLINSYIRDTSTVSSRLAGKLSCW